MARPGDMSEVEDEPDTEVKPVSASAQNEAFEIVQAIRNLILAEQEEQMSHMHMWAVAGVNTPEGTPHPRASLIPGLSSQQTHVLLRCRECNWPMSMALTGSWTEEQLKGSLDAPDNTTSN